MANSIYLGGGIKSAFCGGNVKEIWQGTNKLFPSGGGGTDCTIGGRTYPFVQIGEQLWTTENLDFKFEGCVIGGGLTTSSPAANYYNNDENTYGINGNKYGLLYNYNAAVYLNNSGLLPNGWHVPTYEEESILISNSGGSVTQKVLNLKNPEGMNLKATGYYDQYGFRLLGVYAILGSCSTRPSYHNQRYEYLIRLDGSPDLISSNYNEKRACSPIRLVRDA